MSHPYTCPNCRTNKTRFNLIDQVAHAVKLDPNSGEVVQEYSSGQLEPFHIPYRGPERKVQCATCGLIEDELVFIKQAEYLQAKQRNG
ncbi:DNA alkylation repair protein [Terrilactibacillus laevilacticus]|uniref:DNA alkylation repair protein n=1 Tax=Terrilactibacillus laevilacticus TaxID=1380157 RepID=UPI00114665DF|nr:DNA alkylation repair protein [Terrilactibacillus laevilacticus]